MTAKLISNGGRLTVTGSTFMDNGSDGVIETYGSEPATVTDSTFTGNTNTDGRWRHR